MYKYKLCFRKTVGLTEQNVFQSFLYFCDKKVIFKISYKNIYRYENCKIGEFGKFIQNLLSCPCSIERNIRYQQINTNFLMDQPKAAVKFTA